MRHDSSGLHNCYKVHIWHHAKLQPHNGVKKIPSDLIISINSYIKMAYITMRPFTKKSVSSLPKNTNASHEIVLFVRQVQLSCKKSKNKQKYGTAFRNCIACKYMYTAYQLQQTTAEEYHLIGGAYIRLEVTATGEETFSHTTCCLQAIRHIYREITKLKHVYS
jgi:hypothetical protein